jgi:hypothetical protein
VLLEKENGSSESPKHTSTTGKKKKLQGKKTGAREVIDFLQEVKDKEMVQNQHKEKLALGHALIEVLRENKTYFGINRADLVMEESDIVIGITGPGGGCSY